METMAITGVKISKNPVSVNEEFTIQIDIKEFVDDTAQRLPMRLGKKERLHNEFSNKFQG